MCIITWRVRSGRREERQGRECRVKRDRVGQKRVGRGMTWYGMVRHYVISSSS